MLIQFDAAPALAEAPFRKLGLDPSIVTLPSKNAEDSAVRPPRDTLCRLDDTEWASIERADVLPSEPPQAEAMGNREVLEAVITAVARNRAWTILDELGVSSEAVRKKFARFARRGIWQALADKAETIDLPSERRADLKAIGRRACMLGR